MLAALTRAPSRYSPEADLKLAQQRANLVVDLMLEDGQISDEDAKKAKAKPAKPVLKEGVESANYFADFVMDQLTKLDIAPRQGPDRAHDDRHQTANRGAEKPDDGPGPRRQESRRQPRRADRDGTERRRAQPRRRHATTRSRHSTAPIRPIASPARRSSRSSIWRRSNTACRPTTCATTRRTKTAAGCPRTTTAAIWAPSRCAKRWRSRSTRWPCASPTKSAGAKSSRSPSAWASQSPLEPNRSLPLGTSEVTLYEMTRAFGAFANNGNRVDPYVDHGRENRRRHGALRISRRAADHGDEPASARRNEPDAVRGRANRHRSARRVSIRGPPAPRPAPARNGTTPGSSVTPPTSSPAFGSATTTARRWGRSSAAAFRPAIWKAYMLAAHRNLPIRSLPGIDMYGEARFARRRQRQRGQSVGRTRRRSATRATRIAAWSRNSSTACSAADEPRTSAPLPPPPPRATADRSPPVAASRRRRRRRPPRRTPRPLLANRERRSATKPRPF